LLPPPLIVQFHILSGLPGMKAMKVKIDMGGQENGNCL
jgi:hypothetical protein